MAITLNSLAENADAQLFDDVKSRILKASLRAFASSGFKGTSIRSIAQSCDISHQLIAHHFGSKEELWEAAVAYDVLEFRRHHDHFNFIQGMSDPREQFETFVRLTVEHVSTHLSVACIFIREALNNRIEKENSTRYQKILEHHVTQYRNINMAFFRRAGEAGILRDIPLDDLWYVFQGAILHRFIVSKESLFFDGLPAEDPDIKERHADAIIKLFMKEEK
jgi:AcrR family transcriptional regulator